MAQLVNLSELFPARFRGAVTLLEETQTRSENHTLEFEDRGKVVPFDAAATVTLTVPENSNVFFPVGTVINIYNVSTGQSVIVEGEPNVNIVGAGVLLPQEEVSLRKRDTNEWVVAGALL